jgi:hypothetical protein
MNDGMSSFNVSNTFNVSNKEDEKGDDEAGMPFAMFVIVSCACAILCVL